MDVEMQANLIQKIISPPSEDCAAGLLDALGLSEPPSRERIHAEIEERLLLPKQKLPDHWLPKYQIHWENELSIPSLIKHEPSPQPTSLSFIRTGLDGRVTGYTETSNPRLSTGLTSTSLHRAPGPSKNFVRGKAGNVPFWPGGLEDASSGIPDESEGEFLAEGKGIRTIPPGFSRGLRLPREEDDEAGLDGLDRFQKHLAAGQDVPSSSRLEPKGPSLVGNSEIDELLPTSRAQLAPLSAAHRSTRRTHVQKREWARVVDINKPMKNFHELVPDMAHKYPFELDTFQKQAVYHLEMDDSVFVAAHTSAGKTVVAEYAIALASKHMTRAIYTSPIKALSNQKFRDFKQTFGSNTVGILTGDVQINPEASCLIMTTEILRSMLYKGADLIRDVEFVIFDEVHYVNDAERGVVWEEVIIMLPDHVNIILLSATVPNTKEFADWVGRTKKKDIYVISTAKRPVPLEHYLYAGKELWKIVDASRTFLGQGYKDAGEALRRKQDKEREAAGLPPLQRLGARAAAPQRGARGLPTGRGGGSSSRGRGGGSSSRGRGQATRAAAPSRAGSPARFNHDKTLYVHLMGNLKKKSLLPVVVFTLSKKRCEENASTLTSLDLCTSTEKSEVHVAVEKALGRLKGSDKVLPQIKRMRDLLSRGIGVHHGGLLPLVKEVWAHVSGIVEILFARGLVKVLFATETFAMGVNMPAKCVVFSGIKKHDGRSFREILAGEYTQMAGRAGRRGLDTTGTVIITFNDELPEQAALTQMILGLPAKLKSQFRLTYSMILNLLRVEALRVEEMIKRSFSENASQRLLPDQKKSVVEGEKKLSQMRRLECDVCLHDIGDYYDTTVSIIDHHQRLLAMALENPHGAKLLSSGRVVILRDGHFKSNVGVILKPAPTQASVGSRVYWVLAVVDSHTKSGKNDKDAQAVVPKWSHSPEEMLVDQAEYELTKVPLTNIGLVTARTIKVEPDSIVERHLIRPMQTTVELLEEVVRSWIIDSEGSPDRKIPEVDWGKMRSLDFQETLQYRRVLEKINCGKSCLLCPEFDIHYEILHGEKVLREKLANLRLAISDQNLELIPDYEQRLDVLRELRFIDENSTVLLKGRVACEINSANELVLTELILENTLGGYEPEEVVALLSCFVFQEKTEVEPVLTGRLESGREAIVGIADRVGRVQDMYKIVAEEHKGLKFGLIEVVYEWAKGMPFDKITNLTDVAEGTIVRVITRLDETCREVRDAARVIGDAELFKKMEEAQNKIKRDIVFAASLYF